MTSEGLRFLLFTCVFNIGFCVNTSMQYRVIEPNNDSVNVTIRTTVILKCDLKADENQTFFAWNKDHVSIGKTRGDRMTYKNRYDSERKLFNVTYRDLVIYKVLPSDEGIYQCQQTILNTRHIGNTLKLQVPHASEEPRLYNVAQIPVRLVNLIRWVYLKSGQELQLKCSAPRGRLRTSITWRIYGHFIKPKQDGIFSIGGINGKVSTKVLAIDEEPEYRTTVSYLSAFLDPKKHKTSTMVTCYVKTEGLRGNKQAMAKIVFSSEASKSIAYSSVLISLAVMLSMIGNR